MAVHEVVVEVDGLVSAGSAGRLVPAQIACACARYESVMHAWCAHAYNVVHACCAMYVCCSHGLRTRHDTVHAWYAPCLGLPNSEMTSLSFEMLKSAYSGLADDPVRVA